MKRHGTTKGAIWVVLLALLATFAWVVTAMAGEGLETAETLSLIGILVAQIVILLGLLATETLALR